VGEAAAAAFGAQSLRPHIGLGQSGVHRYAGDQVAGERLVQQFKGRSRRTGSRNREGDATMKPVEVKLTAGIPAPR